MKIAASPSTQATGSPGESVLPANVAITARNEPTTVARDEINRATLVG